MNPTEQTAALALAPTPAELATTPDNELDLSQQRPLYWTNLNPTDDVQAVKLLKALSVADHQLDDAMGQPLTITACIAQAVQKMDPKTGEVIPLTRVVLIDADGQSYACCSDGIRKSLQSIMALPTIGKGPWMPPLLLKPYKVPGRQAGKLFLLEYLGRFTAPKTPAAPKSKAS